MRRRVLTVLFVVVSGAAVLVVRGPEAGATGPSGRIVFSSTLPVYPLPEDFNVSRIYSVGLDGRRKNLSGNPGSLSDEPVSVSPDGSKIAFVRGGEWWLMNADGSGQRRLFSLGAREILGDSATWSPDGTKLAIEVWWSCYRSAPVDTCTDTGGSVIVDLNGNRIGLAGLHPSWSPDGKRLASDIGNLGGDATEVDYNLEVLAADGAQIGWSYSGVRLPEGDCLGFPVWSPNGRWIAALTTGCEANTGVFPSTVYLIPVAGRKVRALPAASDPIWSSQGSRLAFERKGTLFFAQGDGTHARPLAKHAGLLSWSPGERLLAFVSGHTLFVARGDGTHARAFAKNTGKPYWSPDGRSLAFLSRQSGQIAVLAASGGPPRKLTSEPPGAQSQLLAWSQNSKHILYAVKVVPGPHGLWTVNPDGSGLTRLTSQEDHAPAWAPDGQKIAFERRAAIYTIRRDGSALKLLLGGPGERDYDPAWSPDGRRIAFIRSTTEYHTDLFVANQDGSHLRRLTSDGGAVSPAWSPDGSEIAFGDSFDGGIAVIHPEGTGRRTLIGNDSGDPAWSPDGNQIAFVQRGGLALMNADGSDPHTIVTTKNPDYYPRKPSWSPDGESIVYVDAGHLYSVDAKGDNRADLTPFPVSVDSRDPDWSRR